MIKHLAPTLAASVTFLSVAPFTWAQTYTVGSLRGDRVIAQDFEFSGGAWFASARGELANPGNFGPAGVVGVQFSILPPTFNVDATSLGGVDIFFAGVLDSAQPLSPAEQADLRNFVLGGGALVITSDVGGFSSGSNSVAAPFVVSWDLSSFLNESPVITDPSHPIILGPFGVVSMIGHASQGSLDDLGTDALEIASNSNGSSIASIPAGALGPGSGPILFFSDINVFSNNATPWGPGITQFDDRILFCNLFAHLSGATGSLGSAYCGPAAPNSTGLPGRLGASGSALASANDVTLTAEDLPTHATTFFITSMTQGFVANPAGSEGNLCLAGSIGRYVGAGQIGNSGAAGSYSLAIDLTQHPQPTGFVQVAAGETWSFQAWHRDVAAGGGATSNFTNGLELAFL